MFEELGEMLTNFLVLDFFKAFAVPGPAVGALFSIAALQTGDDAPPDGILSLAIPEAHRKPGACFQ